MSNKTFASRFFRSTLLGALLFVGAAHASLTANGSASAEVTENPLSVASTSETLVFGKFSPGAGGDITIDPDQTHSTRRTADSNLTFDNSVTPTAAKFTVTGDAARTYTINVPTGFIQLTSGTHSMQADGFTSDKATGQIHGAAGTGSNTDDFYVGATLHVNPAQEGGVYSGAFDVTVAYN
ncbi:MAG: DUF4402 domain-containing protein [Myxococcaceae bacterium]